MAQDLNPARSAIFPTSQYERDMPYTERFSADELAQVISESFVYMCACPAQVAEGILKLRALYRYQMMCLSDAGNQVLVHQAIAESTAIAHTELEACMERVLQLEGWDRATLQMPESLRNRQMKELLAE